MKIIDASMARIIVLAMICFLSVSCGVAENSGDEKITGAENKAGGQDKVILSKLLKALRTDTSATLLAVSVERGWPVKTNRGYLVVDQAPFKSHVAGDFDNFAGTPMIADQGFAYAIVDFSPGDSYRFTDGVDSEADPWARAYGYDAFGEFSLFEPSSAHLERHRLVSSTNIPERWVHVWVPEETVTHLLYAQDGQNLFDPGAPWGGWNLQSMVPTGMMVVGIESSADRIDEYTHVTDDVGAGVVGGNAAAFADYLQNDVRPLIADQYGEPAKIGLLGSSLGGLVSLYIASRFPAEFDFVASMSGTVGWGSIGAGIQNQTIIQLYASAPKPGFSVYLDSGGSGICADADGDGTDDDGIGSDNYCENLQLRNTLVGLGYQLDTDLWYWWEMGAPGDEAAWSNRVWRPLGHFAGL